MPNYFSLTNKETGEVENLADVDNALCAHLGVEPDERHYYAHWKDYLGLCLAMGQTWEKINEQFHYDDYPQIIDWLESHYEVKSWYSRK